jgi:hypothetical protein
VVIIVFALSQNLFSQFFENCLRKYTEKSKFLLSGLYKNAKMFYNMKQSGFFVKIIAGFEISENFSRKCALLAKKLPKNMRMAHCFRENVNFFREHLSKTDMFCKFLRKFFQRDMSGSFRENL